MKTIVIRSSGAVILLVVLLLDPAAIGQPVWRIAWETAASLLFAFAMIYLTGPCRAYALFTVASVTAILPLAVLFAIGQPSYSSLYLTGQLTTFISRLASSLSGRYVEAAFVFFLPIIASAACVRPFERMALHAASSHAGA
jgi:hypothetical protein